MQKELSVGKKNNFANLLLDIFTIALLIIYFLPQFISFQFTNSIVLFLGTAWVFVAFLSNPHFFLGGNKYFTIAIICFGILIIIPFLISEQSIANRYTSLGLTAMFYWMYSYNSVYRGLKYNLRIVLISLIPIIYTTLITIGALQINPYASRLVKSSIDENIELAQSGVSGYSLIYAVVIIVVSLIPLIIEKNIIKLSKLSKLLILTLLVVFLYLIILSNFFTALIVTFFGIIFIIVLFRNKRILFLLIPISLIYLTFHKEINLTVIDKVIIWVQPEGITYIRLQEMKNEITTGTKTFSVDSRSDTLEGSLDIFMSYPMMGYLASSETDFDLQKIGQHSTVLDTFAMYGIVMGSFFLWIMLLPIKHTISRSNNYKMKVFGLVIGLIFLFLILFNNLTPSMGYAVFFVYPTIFDYLNHKMYASVKK